MTRYLTDIHSHILPGVDDGSESMEMSMEMIEQAYTQGVRRMIATPHYYPGHRNPSAEHLLKTAEELRNNIKKMYSDFTLYLGNEIYYRDGVFEKLKNKEIFTLADTRYVLVEFSYTADFNKIYEAVRKFMNHGYYPVIAHIERYGCLQKNEKNVKELVRAGAYMQVNAENFHPGLFVPMRNYCMKLMEQGLVHFIGSDCHNLTDRVPNLMKGISYLDAKVDKEILDSILGENTDNLLANKCIN